VRIPALQVENFKMTEAHVDKQTGLSYFLLESRAARAILFARYDVLWRYMSLWPADAHVAALRDLWFLMKERSACCVLVVGVACTVI
jgi:hypothetical protein